MTKDPVCKMIVGEKAAYVVKTEYKGTTYYFCGLGYKERFENDTEKYLREEAVDWVKG